MSQEIKTPVIVVQELIAAHTTRKEACAKITAKNPSPEIAAKIKAVAAQSDLFINELMNELSQFGDAVMASVSNDDEYQQLWNATLSGIDQANAADLFATFREMEKHLVLLYRQALDSGGELPQSLQEILLKQMDSLATSMP